jgi:hypothetical protein
LILRRRCSSEKAQPQSKRRSILLNVIARKNTWAATPYDIAARIDPNSRVAVAGSILHSSLDCDEAVNPVVRVGVAANDNAMRIDPERPGRRSRQDINVLELER